jgi:hypothetical protein
VNLRNVYGDMTTEFYFSWNGFDRVEGF